MSAPEGSAPLTMSAEDERGIRMRDHYAGLHAGTTTSPGPNLYRTDLDSRMLLRELDATRAALQAVLPPKEAPQ